MIVERTALIRVELIHKNKDIPEDQENDFKEWLINKGKELGKGWHHEYYDINENHLDDIHVKFLVSINFVTN